MSVVLRCPTCGTTQGHAGECEACSEGEVRYFCTNHDGGVWLDGPVCGSCGAKFGDPPRKPPTPRTSSVPTRPAGAPDFRPPSRRRAAEPSSEPDFGETAAEARRTRGTGGARGAAADAVAGGVARGNHRGARARPGALRGRRHTVGEAAGGASSARVPPCRLSRQNCGPRVPADRRCDHLPISIVRRLHRQLSSVCGHAGPEVASVLAEVIHRGARQGVGYWRLLRDQGS